MSVGGGVLGGVASLYTSVIVEATEAEDVVVLKVRVGSDVVVNGECALGLSAGG